MGNAQSWNTSSEPTLPSTPTELPSNTNSTRQSSGNGGNTNSGSQRLHRPIPTLPFTPDRPPDEFIDGGFMNPVNHLYTQTEPYSTRAVRSFICERKLAPFYRGIPEPDDDEIPIGILKEKEVIGGINVIPQEFSPSTDDSGTSPPQQSQTPTSLLPLSSGSGSKYTAGPTTQVQSNTQFANGSFSRQQVEAQIHKLAQLIALHLGSQECPICFLYYPSNINRSRCCDQPICSECFIQIKRPETGNTPTSCPYCVEPNFGVVYTPPPQSLQSSFVLTKKGELKRQELHARPISSLLPSAGLRRAARNDSHDDSKVSNAIGNTTLPVPVPGTPGLSTSAPTGQRQTIPDSREDGSAGNDLAGVLSGQPASTDSTPSMSPPQVIQDYSTSPTNSLPESTSGGRRKSISYKDNNVVTADEIRPDYVRRLQQMHLQQLHEQQASRARYLALAAAAAASHQQGGGRRQGSGSTRHAPIAINLGYELLGASGMTEGSRGAASHLLGINLGGGEGSSSRSSANQNGDSNTTSSGGPNGTSSSQSRRRRFRRDHGGSDRSYYAGMRHIGADLEELMIMEAVRQSLAEEADRKRNETNESSEIQEAGTLHASEDSSTSSTNVPATSSSTVPPTLPGTGRAGPQHQSHSPSSDDEPLAVSMASNRKHQRSKDLPVAGSADRSQIQEGSAAGTSTRST